MLYYLIVCRSLTYAQRTAAALERAAEQMAKEQTELALAALERAGISARILRSPKSIAGEGCSHSVRLAQRNLPRALQVLKRAELTPKQIYITAGDGSYQEVDL